MLNLDAYMFSQLSMAVEVIELRRALNNFQAHDWPNLKKESRAKIFNSIRKKMSDIIETRSENKRTRTTSELFKLLATRDGYGRDLGRNS